MKSKMMYDRPMPGSRLVSLIGDSTFYYIVLVLTALDSIQQTFVKRLGPFCDSVGQRINHDD